MTNTKKTAGAAGANGSRKGPTESATKFSIGVTKRGNDGNMWTIISTASGVHRWVKTQSKTRKTAKHTESPAPDSSPATQSQLVQMTKKYHVTTSGSKNTLAERLWRVAGSTIPTKDLTKIVDLLPKDKQKEVNKKIKEQIEHPITDYRGMWKPQPKPLTQMSRTELLNHIRNFRDVWGKITTRNQDLSEERLAGETDKELREHLKWYYSNSAKIQSEEWLR